jgi:hypothetical protein
MDGAPGVLGLAARQLDHRAVDVAVLKADRLRQVDAVKGWPAGSGSNHRRACGETLRGSAYALICVPTVSGIS